MTKNELMNENLNGSSGGKLNENEKFCKEKENEFNDDEEIDCISKVIGNFGPCRRKFVIFYMLIYLISPFHNYGIIFYSAPADFWCADDNFKNISESERSLIVNKCIPGCKDYEHDKSFYQRTIINEWDLVCDNSWYVSTAASVYQLGYGFSSVIVGYLGDRYGRAPTFKGTLIFEIITGLGQSFAPTIHLFLISRFLLGVAAYGRFLTGVLLIMEVVGPTKRSVFYILVENSFYFGHYILILFFYYLPNFRWVQATVTTIQILSLFYFHLIPESIRWNIVQKRYCEAKTSLRILAIAKYKDLNLELLDKRIDKLIAHYELEVIKEKSKKKSTIFQLWSKPKMLSICICLYTCWFTNHLINYSAAFNLSNFGSNLFINLTVFTTASFVSNNILYLIIERFNRRTLIRVAYFVIIVCTISLSVSFHLEAKEKALTKENDFLSNSTITDKLLLMPEESIKTEHSQLLDKIFDIYGVNLRNMSKPSIKPLKPSKNSIRLWLGMLLKCFAGVCFHAVYLLSLETFPTVIRQLSMGTCSVASRFATVLAPFTKELSQITGLAFTYGVFCSLAVCACTLIFFVPETRGQELKDTLADCLKEEGDIKEKEKLTNESLNSTSV